MEQQTQKPEQQTQKKVIFASVVGTIVEYYDFAVYGYMATTLAVLFFQKGDPTAALLNTLVFLAVAFFLRTPGGILFGHIGDRFGRKNALAATILLMCVATVGIGVLPTYQSVGVAATVLLVLMRCLQGVAAGGELGGAASYLAESSPAERRAFFTAFVHLGSLGGSLLASLAVLWVTSTADEEVLLGWAWRVPFLLSLSLALVGLWIRSRLDESAAFVEAASEKKPQRPPISVLFAEHGKALIRVLLLAALITGGYYAAYVYGAIYIQKVGGMPPGIAYLATAVTIVVSCLVVLLAGLAADRFGRVLVLRVGSIAGIVLALPSFALMAADNAILAVLGNVLLGIPVAVCLGATFATFAELFPTSVRYTGIALGFNITQALLGGTAAFISQWLVETTGDPASPGWYFLACAVVSLIATVRLVETRGTKLQA